MGASDVYGNGSQNISLIVKMWKPSMSIHNSVVTKLLFEGNATLHEDLGTLHTDAKLPLYPFLTGHNHMVV